MTGMEKRASRRARKMVAHISSSWEEAEKWDLEFWQSRTPEERLSALVAIREDVEAVRRGRRSHGR